MCLLGTARFVLGATCFALGSAFCTLGSAPCTLGAPCFVLRSVRCVLGSPGCSLHPAPGKHREVTTETSVRSKPGMEGRRVRVALQGPRHAPLVPVHGME